MSVYEVALNFCLHLGGILGLMNGMLSQGNYVVPYARIS